MKPTPGPATNGVLLLDKPAGISSNAALQRVRRLFGWAKAGHTGTLDPLATGLLPVCLGEATKFSHALLDADKSYRATLRLGYRSSTGDAEGEIRQGGEVAVTLSQIQTVLLSLTGPISQVPPMTSALKKDGKPLYAYARAGESVDRQPRNILIKRLQIIDLKEEVLIVEVDCSKGTYIRVLAEDIGDRLGCGAYLQALRRTAIRDLGLQEAVDLDALAEMGEAERAARLLPLDRLVQNFPAIVLADSQTTRIVNGLGVDRAGPAGIARLYDSQGAFLGLGETRPDGVLVPKRLVATDQRLTNRQLAPK